MLKNDFYQLIKTNEFLFDFITEPSKGLWFCHLNDTKNVWTSPECRQTLGHIGTDVIYSWHDTILKEDLDGLIKILDNESLNLPVDYLIRYKHQNGTEIQTICTSIRLRLNEDDDTSVLLVAIKQVDSNEEEVYLPGGFPINYINSFAEERKRLDEELRISEERFRRVFEHAAIGMALVSQSGQWMRINSSLSNMLGYSPYELMSLTFQQITYPEDLDKDLSLLNELVAGNIESYQMEKRYFHKKGHLVWVILAVSMVRNKNGKVLHFISQITDISKIKAVESEIKAVLDVTNDQNRRLLNFAHIVSHNLRSHSGNLTMLLNFIETDQDEHSRNELFGMFRHAAHNLQATIEHLNEVVAVNTALHQNLIKVNLSKAINGAIGNIEALLKSEAAVCINEVEETVVIDAIPAYLDSILLNFLTNSIKYHSNERVPVIKLSSKPVDQMIELSIEDNGLGIDLKQNRDKIFGMYKTFHNNKDARGIGLFITKNQIEAMGGKVTVESEVNKGTTFKVYFKKS